MKRWILASLIVPLFFAACAEKNDSPAPAVAPPTTCMNGTTFCDSSLYGYNQGFSAYPQNPYYYNIPISQTNPYHNPNLGNFCSCPAGQRPVYNGNYGLGCVNENAFQGFASSAVYWSWGANNNQWVNPPQMSNSQGYYGNKSSCYQSVAQSCLVDQPNSCGTGILCRPTGGGSRVGICVTGAPVPASANAGASTAAPLPAYR